MAKTYHKDIVEYPFVSPLSESRGHQSFALEGVYNQDIHRNIIEFFAGLNRPVKKEQDDDNWLKAEDLGCRRLGVVRGIKVGDKWLRGGFKE